MARLIRSGLRTAMLTGNGLSVRDFVSDVERTVDDVGIRVFSSKGEQVYGGQGIPVDLDSIPPAVVDALRSGVPAGDPQGLLTVPLHNEQRCRRCHQAGELRGVIALQLDASLRASPKDVNLLRVDRVLHAAFERMMTIGQAKGLDAYFDELAQRLPGFQAAGVFSLDGEPTLGEAFLEPPEAVVRQSLKPGRPFVAYDEKHTYLVHPLANSDRCRNCHTGHQEMRGSLIAQLDTEQFVIEDSLEALLTVSTQHVMLSGLGRILKAFLDESAASGLYTQISVYDDQAHPFHDVNRSVAVPASVRSVLRSRRPTMDLVDGENSSRLRYLMPLANEPKCQRCHGSDRTLRGVIEVSGELDDLLPIMVEGAKAQHGVSAVNRTRLLLEQWLSSAGGDATGI